jgi:hypothetical protein
MKHLPAILAAIVFAVMATITALMVGKFGYLTAAHRPEFLVTVAVVWVLFVAGTVLLRRVPARTAIAIILAASAATGCAALVGPPDTSTDSARYSWDGIVQDAGISPYRYGPNDSAVAKLRPDWLFALPVYTDSGPHCPESRRYLTHSAPTANALCTAINRPGVPTIYPPASELLFAAVRGIVPSDAQYWPFQLTGLLISLAITVLLIVGLRRRGLNPRWAALWALCPLTASEAVTNAHVDILGSLLTLLAVFALASGARWRGGVLLGAAIAAKLIPVLAAFAVLRRQPWKIIVTATVTFAVLYIPYVAATGLAVVGYLPGYLSEEGYDSGNRFVLLRAFLPASASLIVAGVLLLSIAVLTVIFSNPQRPWLGELVVIGAALIIASPPFAWYALLLIPFVAMSGRWEWLAIPAALTLHVFVTSTVTFRWSLLAALVAIAAGSFIRANANRTGLPAAGHPNRTRARRT